MPNQRMNSGTSAYFGMPTEAMMYGSTAAVSRGKRRSRNGSATPKPQPIAKPITESRSVTVDVPDQLAGLRVGENALPRP